MSAAPWVTDANAGLLTDLYELRMVQAYLEEGMTDEAVFELTVRTLPPQRNYLLACGLADVLHHLQAGKVPRERLDELAPEGPFSRAFLDYLAEFRFEGSVSAVPEGTPVFAGEPLLTVRGSLPQAQLVETFLLNQIHLQTVAASKAARVVTAAAGRPVVDFALRRTHGADAGVKATRAFHVAGVAGTSNVLAGLALGIPLSGTMAHSYVEAHEDEHEAFRAFVRRYPGTTVLVDTYDALQGVARLIELARELGPEEFSVRAIRLDSGDLAALARAARAMLDAAGLNEVGILASGNLDEHAIARLVEDGAPIAGFGVGTRMGVSADAPALDCVYKLIAYAGRGRAKLSHDKTTLPGPKQVFRFEENGVAVRDVIARADETLDGGRPLLAEVMRGGRRLAAGARDLKEARTRAREELSRLPARCRALAPAQPPYPVELSPRLAAEAARVHREVGRRAP